LSSKIISYKKGLEIYANYFVTLYFNVTLRPPEEGKAGKQQVFGIIIT
jgi:hypothetical protein